MTWFRVDDGLPEHRKSIALWKACKSDWKVYAVACWAWRDMGCDCAHWNTHGVFERDRAHRVLRAPEKVVDAALDALVAAGFLTSEGDTFAFHDWQEYQPTREEIAARKAAISEVRSTVGKKGGVRSGEVRRGSKREANAKQSEANRSNDEPTVEQSGSPVSRIPVPVSDPSSPTPSQQPAPAESTDAPKADPTMTKAKPPAVPVVPAVDPESTDPTDLLNALAASSSNVFDRFAGGDAELPFIRRLADYGINVRRANRLGTILAEHATTMPKMWVKRGEKIRMSLLMGPCGSNGQRGGTWLSVAVGILEAAERAEVEKATRAAATPAAPAAPLPMLTAAQFAAAKNSPSAPSFLRPVSATNA